MSDLTQARLKELLSYDPNTGVFIWLVKRPPKIFIGSIAGSLNDRGYRRIDIDRKQHKAHRLVWLYIHGEFPNGEIDHINREKADNRLVNLRVVTRAVNQQNCALRKRNTSGVTGVCWDKRRQKWQAYVKVNKKQNSLGYFAKIEEAIAARKAAEKKFYSLPE